MFYISKLVFIFVINMNFKTNLPEISSLRIYVEQKVGQALISHNDFILLVDKIERELKEHISESTLERVWGYSTRGYDTVSLRTLSLLARYIGHADWYAFIQHLRDEGQIESEMFTGNTLIVGRLVIGSRLRIGWLPNRIIIVRYLGDNRFVTEETHNSSIKPGDTFSCIQMQIGREMYMDLFQRASDEGNADPNARYVVGQRSGLTTLEIIK